MDVTKPMFVIKRVKTNDVVLSPRLYDGVHEVLKNNFDSNFEDKSNKTNIHNKDKKLMMLFCHPVFMTGSMIFLKINVTK